MPGTTTTSQPSDTAARLDIAAVCPKCGGENSWRLMQTMRLCDYCGSALWWPRDPSRPGVLVAEDAAADPEAVLDVLRTLDAMRERSRLAGILADRDRANGERPIDRSDDPTLPSVAELKEQRRHLFALEADHKVLAPYLLVSSTLVFHALGRSRSGGVKEFRNIFFRMEEISPAYSPPWDFRDRGLWVAKQRLRPFTPQQLALRPIPGLDHAVSFEAAAKRWRGQRLLILPDLDPIAFDSDLLAPGLWRVFRPFHYVRARTPMRNGWFLVDGQFANVAGYPDDEEVVRATAPGWKPLDAQEIRAAAPHVLGLRCPECGADVPLVERTELQLCTNCGRLLEPSAQGLTTHPYTVVDRASIPWWPSAADADVAWLPFFRVETTVSRPGAPGRDFAALLREAMPVLGPAAPLLPDAWPESWIPAFEALTVGRYDAWAFEWAAALTKIRPESFERRFVLEEPIEKANRVVPVAFDWESLRPLFPRLLLELLPKPLQVRLNPMILKQIFASTIQAANVSLVFAPAPVVSDGERRVIGPSSSVGWIPLRDGVWPPDLQRDVRRAMDRGKRLDKPEDAASALHTWTDKRSSS
jgi:ribosomal protein L37AE/L43A